jgi:hypothetical protein
MGYMTPIYRMRALVAALVIAGVAGFASFASADHTWGTYHWARTTSTFTLKLGNNLSPGWQSYLTVASADWSLSDVLDTSIVTGNAGRNCKATAGRVEVCNAKYGNNGWLGIASIWISGSHITQGTVKMNDTYFNTATYNKPSWKQMVLCQEIGHTFGLDHQDENFNNQNLGTCMDYSNDPARDDGQGNNLHPNAHDYNQLALIYAHLDTATTVSQSTSSLKGNADHTDENRADWGREIRRSENGRASVFEKDFGNGEKRLTHVFWAEPRGR